MNRASFRQKKDLKKKRGIRQKEKWIRNFCCCYPQYSTGGCNKIIESSYRQEIFSSLITC